MRIPKPRIRNRTKKPRKHTYAPIWNKIKSDGAALIAVKDAEDMRIVIRMVIQEKYRDAVWQFECASKQKLVIERGVHSVKFSLRTYMDWMHI